MKKVWVKGLVYDLETLDSQAGIVHVLIDDALSERLCKSISVKASDVRWRKEKKK